MLHLFVTLIHYYCIVGETPYVANVKALNDIGQAGLSNKTIFFTREQSMYNLCSCINITQYKLYDSLFQFLLLQLILVS